MKKISANQKIFLVSVASCLCLLLINGFSWQNLSFSWTGISLPVLADNQLPEADQLTNTRFISTGKNGAVVSTSRYATEVGLDVLKNKGNAIDAAVAVGYAAAVSDPCCGNLGGGGFMTIHLANGQETFINFRETAPGKSTANMYLDSQGKVVKDLSTKGYLAVGVPGTVKGLNYALKKYGTMTREQVINPAIKLAEDGYALQRGDVEIFKAGQKRLQDPSVAKIFLDQQQKILPVGTVLKQPELAQTLRQLIPEGDAFYQGEIAQKVVAASEANGGILSLADFANYQVSEYQPIACNYRGYRVISSPPPGGGTTLCQMLNILAGYDLQKSGWHTTESLHRILSAMLFAFGDRNTYLGDPDFVDNPLDLLLSQEYAAQIRQQIPGNRAVPPEAVYNREVQEEGTNTTHYSVIDSQGNAVAVTYTINSFFGAGVAAPGTGFLLNNEMDDFTSKVGVANQFGLKQGSTNIIEPGKRPLSSMSPTIVMKGDRVVLVTGSPGGSTIPTTVLQVITNLIDYQKSPSEAVNTPRFHYQGFPKWVRSETSFLPTRTVRGLIFKGYKLINSRKQWGGAESIYVDPQTGLITAVNDKRKPAGRALAY
ncbi:MAG: gamma-glutamyltransferase [Cyanobacteria bacterium J06642_3]